MRSTRKETQALTRRRIKEVTQLVLEKGEQRTLASSALFATSDIRGVHSMPFLQARWTCGFGGVLTRPVLHTNLRASNPVRRTQSS